MVGVVESGGGCGGEWWRVWWGLLGAGVMVGVLCWVFVSGGGSVSAWWY